MKCRVRKVLGGDESQTQVRLCLAGGSQDKQLQSLQQPADAGCQVRGGQTPTEAERSCNSTQPQLGGKSSSCTEAAPLHAGHQALIWSYIYH